MTLAELQRAAAGAVADYVARCRRVDDFLAGKPDHKPEYRANLVGEFPMWAHYVLTMGEPARGAVTLAQVQVSLGTARNIRAFALRLLELADEQEPVEAPT